MTGGRDGRSEGSKQLDSGTALFPRLHVAETKRAGPRGPPRNKMALFEQLTVPSHKFKPSPMPLPSTGRTMKSPAMTTPIYLPISQVSGGSQDSMYSYVPMSYMSPTMIPTMACIPSYSYSGLYNAEATNSMNTSGSKSTIVDGGEESPYDGGSVPKGLGHSKLQAPTKKGRGDDDFAVPTYSSATQSSGQTTRPLSPLHTRIAPRGQRALLRSKGPVVQKQFPSCQEKCMEVTSSERKDNTGWSTASGECVTVSVAGNEVDSQETDQRELERVPSSESYPTTIPADNVCRVDRLTAMFDQQYKDDLLSNIRSESQSGEGSEPSQHTRGSSAETGSSMLENAPAGSVRFQDVVSAFGQREFWKTQMIMIRQQRIFSRQVFELHRVIEVQKLLSKALFSSPSGDEALEKEDDNVHMAESPVARVPEVPQAESPVAEVPEVSLIAEAPSIAEAPQVPEVAERRPELNGVNENSRPNVEAPHQPVYPMPAVSTQQAFNREAPWPAPPYPPNPWAVRMSPSFMYVPYPGHYPPGYGAYPMMGASMPMYGTPGAMQQQQPPPPGMPMIFPSWQQPPGMPMVMGPQDSAAMAAWYSQQVPSGQQVPAAAMGASASIAPPSCPRDRLTSSGSGESTSQIAVTRQADRDGAVPSARLVTQEGAVVFNARQADQDGAVQNARQAAQAGASFVFRQGGHDGTAFSARQGDQDGAAFIFRQGGQDGSSLDARQASEDGENSSKRSSGEPRGWAKGWGRRKGRWVRGDRSLLRKNDSDFADLRGSESDSLSGDIARGGGDLGLEGVQPTNDCPSVVEPDASSEGRRERFASLKHMRSESAFESGACRWFPILSPSKRPMHHNGVIKVVPRAVSATPELAANILLSIQTDKRL